jgi:sugar (pentulose or hexulose) kinase
VSEAQLLGIDLGTTALKCGVYTATGDLVALATTEFSLDTPTAVTVEAPIERYWDALRSTLGELLAKPAVNRSALQALAISAQGETLVPVDSRGNALRKAIVWLDNRADAEARELAATLGEQWLYETTGQPEMVPTWPAAKVLWLRKNEPTVFAATDCFMLIEDYVLLRLTGQRVTEGSLTTSTCYWDFRTKQWSSPVLDVLGVRPDQLPTIMESGVTVGPLRADAAADLGLPGRLTVVSGALDQAAGAIGAGNITPGEFSENTGAAVALCATIDGPRLDPQRQMPCHYHAAPDTYMFHTFTSGGIVLKWFRDQFCENLLDQAAAGDRDGYDLMSQAAATVGPGSEGLVMLPHLQGAMAPENNPNARGALIGLTLRHGRAHVIRAVMESISFIIRRNVDELTRLGVSIEQVRSLGGGSRSDVWKQIEADVTGLPVMTTVQSDGATLGAAILAGVGVGLHPSAREAAALMVGTRRVFEPDAAAHAVYNDLYAQYRAGYYALVPVFDHMASMSSGA